MSDPKSPQWNDAPRQMSSVSPPILAEPLNNTSFPNIPVSPGKASQGPVPVAADVMARRLISSPSPLYPPIARAAHISGTIVLGVVISNAGTVTNCSALSGPEMLKGAAIEAVCRWKYNPYLVQSEPIEVETTVSVDFNIGQG